MSSCLALEEFRLQDLLFLQITKTEIKKVVKDFKNRIAIADVIAQFTACSGKVEDVVGSWLEMFLWPGEM